MHRNNLALEDDCSWGVVDKEPHYVTVKAEEDIISQLL